MKSKLTTMILMTTLALGAFAHNAMAGTGKTALSHAAVSKKTPAKAGVPSHIIPPNARRK